MSKGYSVRRLSMTRKMVIAAVRGNKKNAIHCISEINVDLALSFRNEQKDASGKKISFTAFLVKCLANSLVEYPEMNSFIRRGKQIILDDLTISVLVEREVNGQSTPEPLAITGARDKSVWEITREIRQAKESASGHGELSGAGWIRFIPAFLLGLFVRLADQNIKMAKKYGKVAITSVGMHSEHASWFIPHGTATVLLTIGGLQTKRELDENGNMSQHKYLKLTASFDHELIDGAPAARFMNKLEEEISSGAALLED